ncbi:MAG: Ig-like domain-containing protein [Bryobacteraceae bacterium]
MRRAGRFGVAFALLLAGPARAEPRGVEVRFTNGVFRVTGDGAERAKLTVFVEGSQTPLLGVHRVEGGAAVFEPRFPPVPGVRYRAVVEGRPPVVATFEIPKAPARSTEVRAVYPSPARLPENLLKFYIEFSGPMSRGDAYRHLRLLDESGKAIELPFLEIDEELWDSGLRRLTVLFDPGRIKRGLLPNEEAGSPLGEGRSYTLVIDPAWRDAAGTPLRSEFRKSFTVGAADRTQPDPASWRVTATRSAVTIDFPEPLDRALLLRLLSVEGAVGTTSLEREETRWVFTPSTPLPPGDHAIAVDTALTDLAGNSVERLFEVDVFERVERTAARKSVRIPFRVAPE